MFPPFLMEKTEQKIKNRELLPNIAPFVSVFPASFHHVLVPLSGFIIPLIILIKEKPTDYTQM